MLTLLCIASYHKGFEFLREAKRQGCRVLLVTSASLRDAEWPTESIDEIFYIQDDQKRWKLDDLILGASHLARRIAIDRIVPLDDFDLEKASALREHLRIPGMGETTTRYFRDKLAMRVKARRTTGCRSRRSSTCSTTTRSARSAGAWRRRGSSSRGIRRARSASARSTARTSCGR